MHGDEDDICVLFCYQPVQGGGHLIYPAGFVTPGPDRHRDSELAFRGDRFCCQQILDGFRGSGVEQPGRIGRDLHSIGVDADFGQQPE